MARTVLIEASPWNPATGAVVPVALAGGGSKAYTHRARNDWIAGVVGEPKFSARIEFDQNGFSGGSRPEFGVLEFMPSSSAKLDSVLGLLWDGAPIEVLVGDDELAVPVWSTRIKGVVETHTVRAGRVAFKVRDNSGDLDKPVASDRFAGTGGLEGDAFVANRVKRRAFGYCSNVEALPLKASTNLYEVADPAFQLTAITDVKDIGRSASALTVIAWQGSAAATLAALEAAAVPQGGGVVAPSIACLRWWTQPVGPLTADVTGQTNGGTLTAPYLAETIIATRSALTLANRDAAHGWRPAGVGAYVDNPSETIAQVLDRLLKGVSLAWNATAAGVIELSEIKLTGPVETLKTIGVARLRQFKPLLRRRVGFLRNHRIHDEGEIASSLRDDAGAILTAGADWSTNVTSRPSNLAALTGSEGVNNASVSISAGGALAGAGGGQVTFVGLGGGPVGTLTAVDLSTSYVSGLLPVARAVAGLINANLSIGSNGALSGGGGGQVTIGGLGYTGALNATFGAAWSTNLTGRPTNLSALAGSEGINNALVSIAANGSLAGGGGGQVTIFGLGYRGDLNATLGDNIVPNSSLAANADRWTLAAGATWAPGSYFPGPVPGMIRDNASFGAVAYINDNTLVPVEGGRKYYASGFFYATTAPADRVRFFLEFYNSSGTYIAGGDAIVTFQNSVAGWGFVETSFNTPSAATHFRGYAYFENSNTAAGQIAFGGLRMSTIEVAATRGATWAVNLLNRPANLAALGGSEGLNNALISISAAGALSGAGGGQVTLPGIDAGYGVIGRTSRLNATTGRSTDGRLLTSNKNYGLRALSEVPTMSSGLDGGGTTAYVTFGSNGVFYPDWGGSILLPSASFPGLALATQYAFWRSMSDPDGSGTNAYGYSTSLADALAPDKIYLGYYTTVSSGGTGGGGGGYGDPGCVGSEALVLIWRDGEELVVPARDVVAGDKIEALGEDLDSRGRATVTANSIEENELVRLTVESGAELTLSINTPMTTPTGHVIAANANRARVPVLDEGGFRWERVTSVDYLGRGSVAKICCSNATYAAGDKAGRFIYSHNIEEYYKF